MRGTGFEPEEDSLTRLPGFEPFLLLLVFTSEMRGTGFEPADPYGTAPSTLRRWPGLATHA